jgi:circadian clock protein KaiB
VTREFEALLEKPREVRYVLRLFVRGATQRSLQAVASLKTICKELNGRYDLEIIDVQLEPEKVLEEQILALPTLVRKLPKPMRHFVGDLANKERVLAGLEVVPCAVEPPR